LTKSVGRTALLSRQLADVLDDEGIVDLGAHQVKGVGAPLNVFGIDDSVPSATQSADT
jgi:hypothetical protein